MLTNLLQHIGLNQRSRMKKYCEARLHALIPGLAHTVARPLSDRLAARLAHETFVTRDEEEEEASLDLAQAQVEARAAERDAAAAQHEATAFTGAASDPAASGGTPLEAASDSDSDEANPEKLPTRPVGMSESEWARIVEWLRADDERWGSHYPCSKLSGEQGREAADIYTHQLYMLDCIEQDGAICQLRGEKVAEPWTATPISGFAVLEFTINGEDVHEVINIARFSAAA